MSLWSPSGGSFFMIRRECERHASGGDVSPAPFGSSNVTLWKRKEVLVIVNIGTHNHARTVDEPSEGIYQEENKAHT